MLQLSTTTDTQLGVKFTVTNMTVTGFTATIEINAKEYTLSPVANDAVAVVTIPLADATAISTIYFGARVTVYDAEGKAYQVSGWPGLKVPYALDELTVDNFIRIDLAPPFPVPDDSGGGGGGGVSFDNFPEKDSKNAVYSGGLWTMFNGVVRSINGTEPDAAGNVELGTVPYAKNLISTDLIVDGPNLFTRRTSGGSADVETGRAYLRKVFGHCTESVHEALGYVTVISGNYTPPSVTIDADTFSEGTGVVAGANTFTYSSADTSWMFGDPPAAVNLSTGYGITVTLNSYSLQDGDKIIADYSPASFTWNLAAADETATASIVESTFLTEVGSTTSATYVFVAVSDGNGGVKWQYGGNDVTLSDYGITITGTIAVDDTLTVNYVSKYATVRFDEYGVSATVDESVFRTMAASTQTPGTTVSYEFEYDNNDEWTLDGSPVTLADYGITTSGTFVDGGSITFPFTLEKMVAVAAPTAFRAFGFNSFDANTMFDSATSTATVPVAYNDSETFRGYVVYSETGAVTSVKQVNKDGTETVLTASSDSDLVAVITDGTTAAGHANAIYVITADADSLKIVTTSPGSLCVHPCWSGQAAWQDAGNADYTAFSASSIAIPTESADGTALPTATYGISGIGTVRDEIDFTNKVYIQRIGMVAQPVTQYAAANPGKVEWTDYVGDSVRTFYVLDTPVEYSLASSVSPEYEVNDWSIEEFVYAAGDKGTAAYATTNYGQNLVRKLVRDVVTKSEMTPEAIRDLAQYEQQEMEGGANIYLTTGSANVFDLSDFSGASITVRLPSDPPAVEPGHLGKAADVLARFDVGASAPTVSFLPTEDIYCPMDGDENWDTMTADAWNFYSFTSMGTDGAGHRVWMVGHFTYTPPTP